MLTLISSRRSQPYPGSLMWKLHWTSISIVLSCSVRVNIFTASSRFFRDLPLDQRQRAVSSE